MLARRAIRLTAIVAATACVAACAADARDDDEPGDIEPASADSEAPTVSENDESAPDDDDATQPDTAERPAEVLSPAATAAAAAPPIILISPDDVDPSTRRRRDSAEAVKLQLVLRSSPAGAIAAVDGKVVGPTPAYWRGDATGKPREFTFVLSGYGMARYRFVPLRDGVVHATLERLMKEQPAGTAGR